MHKQFIKSVKTKCIQAKSSKHPSQLKAKALKKKFQLQYIVHHRGLKIISK